MNCITLLYCFLRPCLRQAEAGAGPLAGPLRLCAAGARVSAHTGNGLSITSRAEPLSSASASWGPEAGPGGLS